MIVGWQVAGHMRTELPLDALEMGLWTRRIKKSSGLIHHSDRGLPDTRPFGIPTDCPASAPQRRSALSRTRTTTRWPRR
ncbi:hypothetical protein [Streptomyces niveiscabiei]|uniref:hypothetical protein n=1 Tax=Streptomyces niveiscabiei TaxID=164115 RepID=UPI00389AD15D